MKGTQRIPGGARFGGQALGDIASEFVKFAPKLFRRFGKNPQLVQEAGASAKEHKVQDAVPGSRALPRIAPEETRLERLDGRKFTHVMAVVDDHLAS